MYIRILLNVYSVSCQPSYSCEYAECIAAVQYTYPVNTQDLSMQRIQFYTKCGALI